MRRLMVLIAVGTLVYGLMESVATAQSCRPSCRSGYTCLDGACVTACNPPCANHERCTGRRECIVDHANTTVAKAPNTWFAHVGIGYGMVGIYTDRPSRVASRDPGESPYRLLDARAPVLGLGFAFQQQINRVLGLRTQLTLIGGSNFGDQRMVAAFLDWTLRIGLVSPRFPWLIGFGPILGAAAMRGVYTNERGVPAGSATHAFAGGKVETGFAFGGIETVAEFLLGLWPGETLSGFLTVGLRLSVAL